MTDTVDPKSFRQGDRVWVEGVLGYPYPELSSWDVHLSNATRHIVPTSDIVRHIPAPRPIEVGDRVKWLGVVATVIHVHGKKVWAEWQTNHDMVSTILSLEDLERLPS